MGDRRGIRRADRRSILPTEAHSVLVVVSSCSELLVRAEGYCDVSTDMLIRRKLAA